MKRITEIFQNGPEKISRVGMTDMCDLPAFLGGAV